MPSPAVPLFALLIGINDYQRGRGYTQRPLRGAVADAESFKELLEGRFGVPDDQITLLRDQAATSFAIINSLRGLATDERIHYGDAIFIYYAGHGTRIDAPANWECGGIDHKIEAIVPYDCDTVIEGRTIAPIEDRHFGALVGQIALAKGNNIFVVFDCCHSGSGTRGEGVDLEATPRSIELTNDYTAILEERLQDHASPRSMASLAESYHFGHYAMESHVFLAACDPIQDAFEAPVYGGIRGNIRGRFSTALLGLLRNQPIENLRYCDILDLIDPIPNQTPQCDGTHKNRMLFNSKIQPVKRYISFAVHYQEGTRTRNGRYVLKAGDMQNISLESQFALFHKFDHSLSTQIGTLSITRVMATESYAVVSLNSPTVDPKSDMIAVQTRPGKKDDLRLFIPNDVLRVAYFKLNQDYYLGGTILAQRSQDSDVGMELLNGNQVLFTVRAYPHPNLHRHRTALAWTENVHVQDPRNPVELIDIIQAAARFYFELKRSGPDRYISNNVNVNFYQLERSPYSGQLAPAEPLIELYREGVITLEHDPHRPYGIKLINGTAHNLFVNMYFFSNRDLSITDCVETKGNSHHHMPDAALKANGTLAIGWGSSGFPPIVCDLEDGHNDNIDFLKIYLSTKPADMSHLTQQSPFSPSRSMKKGYHLEQQTWADIIIPIIQVRRR